MLRNFIRRPQSTWFRKALFQVHLWTGLPLAIYVLLVGISGTILVFEPELEALEYPQFFAPATGGATLADPAVVLANVQRAYPGFRVSSVNWPTPERRSFVSYPSRPGDSRTVFADPATGRVLGELPDTGFVRTMWNLHVYLLAGRPGLKFSGIASGLTILVGFTGLVLWWPGIVRWTRALVVDFTLGWKRITWDLHNVVGFWTVGMVVLWSLSGVYLTYSQEFRAAVNVVFPLTARARPQSDPARQGTAALPAPQLLVERALAAVPGSKPARYTVANGDRGAIIVVVDRGVIGDRMLNGETWVHFDRYDGSLLATVPQTGGSFGDLVIAWMFPLHAGWFGGVGIKILWLVLSLSFPLLGITGTIMWWNRVIVPAIPELRQRSSIET